MDGKTPASLVTMVKKRYAVIDYSLITYSALLLHPSPITIVKVVRTVASETWVSMVPTNKRVSAVPNKWVRPA
jgi:hypothetical protein